MKPAVKILLTAVAAAVALQVRERDSRRETLDELMAILRPSRPPVNGRINRAFDWLAEVAR